MRDPAVPRTRAPELDPALARIGAPAAAVSLAALRGRVVLLDFFTAGCINCRHLVPTLHALAARHGDALAIVGVHCGKYPAERDDAFIADACQRLGIDHPVVNDRHFRTWRAYAVRAWPTLVVVDPEGFVVGMHAGECTADELSPFLDPLVAAARGTHGDGAPRTPPHRARPALARDATRLHYPAPLALHGDGRTLALADRARVLVGEIDEHRATCTIVHVSGDGVPAHVDGDGPRWLDPQGLAWLPDGRLAVADAGAHALRTLDVHTGAATTRAGTGVRVRSDADRAAGALASPWGLAVVGDALHVAMAGDHRLWRHALDAPATPAATRPWAGTGGEAIVDGPADAALFAQPTALATDGTTLWVACAEGNAIRAVDLATRTVTTLVGTGLFAFGHRDGTGDAALLQHPQGLAWDPYRARLVVADSYNGALRALDPVTRACTTLVRGLAMPVGVAVLPSGALVVAEESGHRLALVAPDGSAVRRVTLMSPMR